MGLFHDHLIFMMKIHLSGQTVFYNDTVPCPGCNEPALNLEPTQPPFVLLAMQSQGVPWPARNHHIAIREASSLAAAILKHMGIAAWDPPEPNNNIATFRQRRVRNWSRTHVGNPQAPTTQEQDSEIL